MKLRHSTGEALEKVEMQMTPMIDIVFQLLIFFLLSFKIVPQEGDFDIKMPLAAPAQGSPTDPVQPILVRLVAAPDGSLAAIQMGERALPSFQALHEEILAIVGTERGPGSLADATEVEIDADYNLHYRYGIEAITAISGFVDPQGNVIRLIDKIKFAQPRPR